MLFVQGTRDAFARWDLPDRGAGRLGAAGDAARVEGGDHSFKVPKRAAARRPTVEAEIAGAVARLAGDRPVSPGAPTAACYHPAPSTRKEDLDGRHLVARRCARASWSRYLTEEEYVRLLADTIPVSAEPGDVIFFKGAPSKSLVIVVEGEVEVFEESSGRMLVLGTRAAGSVVGEVGFLDGRPRTRPRARDARLPSCASITRDGLLAARWTRTPMLFAKMMVALSELLASRYRGVVAELEPVRALAASLRDAQTGRIRRTLSLDVLETVADAPGTCAPSSNGRPGALLDVDPPGGRRSSWSCARSALTFETRALPAAGHRRLASRWCMEGRPLALHAPVSACLVTDKDRGGYIYQPRVSLDALSEADRHLVALFIEKGRGEPGLQPAPLPTRCRGAARRGGGGHRRVRGHRTRLRVRVRPRGRAPGVCARRADRLQELAAQVAALGAEVLVQRGGRRRRAARCARSWTRPSRASGASTCSSTTPATACAGRVEDTPAEDYRRLMEVNYLGTVYGCRAAVP